MTDRKLTAIIVDDEPLALEGLRIRLEKTEDVEVIAEAQDGDSAIQACQKLSPDVLFLDLQMPGLNGLEVVQALQSDTLPFIVFVSAYSDYAVDAFELNAIDYILKPVNLGRLQKTIERLKERFTPQSNEQEKHKLLQALGQTSGVAIAELEEWLSSDEPMPTAFPQELVIKNSDNERVFVSIDDIRWIDAAGDYMCVHADTETHIIRITMKKLTEQLDQRVFQRIHKSTLVNVNYIKGIQPLKNNESMLDLGKDIKLKVSRNYSDAVQAILGTKVNLKS
ncbi:MAG: response regulator transcription factor [Gammaproteobacteria bacterium]|nr:response regulator transcription factor [Gammaproteobacteria bacterium]